MFENAKKKLKSLNPLSDTLIMGPKVFDCDSFEDEDHPLHAHGFTFPCGLVEISGSGTLLSERDKEHTANDTIDKTLYCFNPDVTDCEVVTVNGSILDYQGMCQSVFFSKFSLRARNIEKIIFKEVS